MDRPRYYRWLEIIPGGLVWTTIIAAIVLSFVKPVIVIYFIILFDLFWVFRVAYFIILLTNSWRRYRRDIRVDWMAKVQALPRSREIWHVVVMPTYKEGIEVLRTTFQSLANDVYPKKERFIFALGGEERDRDNFLVVSKQIQEEFGDKFFKLLITIHPKDLPGEIPGKGSNNYYIGQEVKKVIDELGIPYENVIVSAFDCDTGVHPQYFSCLTYKYLTASDPTRSSYQPLALYNNNIWDAPAIVRLAAFGTSYWLLTELIRPDRLATFASHSMSFKMLVDVGFWERDIVTEDSRIFFQALIKYNGDYRVTPMYIPISMDAAMASNYWKSIIALYKQQRRWAWGIEHFPYLVHHFIGNKFFPLKKKIFYVWVQLEGMYTWATAALLIFMLGYLPLWTASASIRATALYQNAPHTLEALMRLSMIGVLVTAMLSFGLLPPRPAHKRRSDWLIMILQWALVPITFTIFGSLPAIDAQTRLMLGKYMGFNVTEKKRRAS